LGWEISEVWVVAGKFGFEGFDGCLHDIEEEYWHHAVALLHACIVFYLAHHFS